jgi:general secretion pathway protein D
MQGFTSVKKNFLMQYRNMTRMVGGIVLALAMVCGTAWAETMTLNLKDADIQTVISTVSEMTGKNFVVDPRVKGKVTIISSQPMAAEDIYQVFLTILNVHGFAAIPGKNVIKILPEVNAKQDAIPTVDRRGMTEADQFVTRVISVKNVTSAQLVPILRPLLPQESHLAAYPPTNVLIASGTAANIDRIVDLVKRIDLSSETEVELITLKHASASELERIINSLQQVSGGKGAAAADEVKVIADTRTNSVMLSGDKTKRHHLKKIIRQLDTPLQSSGNTRVIYLRYAKATDLADVLNGVGKSIAEDKSGGAKGKNAPQAKGTKLTIQADEATNALVINAAPDVIRDLEAVIRQLDVRRAQVMVRAVIAEVGMDTAMELGIQWGANGSDDGSPVGLIDFNNTILGVAQALEGLASPPSLNGLTLAAGDFGSGEFNFAGILRALGGDSNNNILSTPSLLTMDNEEAEIVVGQTVPFITGSYSSTGNGASPTNPFQTIQREDVGLSLKIKPQINEGDAIRMEVTQEVSSISGTTVSASDLITNKRSVKTTVMVDDGQVLVLGGLIEDQLVESEQKVPLLGDIPLLGWFFRYQKNIKQKKDLMVFIHPRILRDSAEGSALASEKYNYMRALQMNIREDGLRLMKDEDAPMLPEMDEFLQLPAPYEEQAAMPLPDVTVSDDVVKP